MSKRKVEEVAGTSIMTRSKKLCTENSPTAPDQLSHFQSMPLEILDNIFKYIPSKDVLNMALVSKHFDCYIGNSKMVMSRFQVTFNAVVLRNSDPDASIGQRNYDKLIIPKILVKDLPYAARLLRKFGSSVKEIEVQEKYSMKMLTTVLGICNKIESFKCSDFVSPTDKRYNRRILPIDQILSANESVLKASTLAIENKLKQIPEPLPLENMKYLDISTVGAALSFFAKSPLKEVYINSISYYWNHYDVYVLKKFLEQQTCIEVLGIANNRICSILFQDNFMSQMKFRLKKLKINHNYSWNETMTPHEIQNLNTFVKLHQESLEELHGSTEAILDCLEDFKALTTLQLVSSAGFHRFNCVVMPQVQNLMITLTRNGHVFGDTAAVKFPNVKKLTINGLPFLNVINPINSISYQRLEKLTLKFLDIGSTPEMIIHTKHLQLVCVRFFDAHPFELDEIMLEILEIADCSNLRWLINFLQRPTTQLKCLKLENMHLTNTYREEIQANRQKIGKLIFNNVY